MGDVPQEVWSRIGTLEVDGGRMDERVENLEKIQIKIDKKLDNIEGQVSKIWVRVGIACGITLILFSAVFSAVIKYLT